MDIIINLNNTISWLDLAEKTATIVAATGIVFAYLGYRNQIKKDERLDVVDQISFFRDKILDKEIMMTQKIRETEKDYVNIKVPYIGNNNDEIVKNSPQNSKKQVMVFERHNTFISILEILNMLEEFSLRIKYSGTVEHPAFTGIKSSFLDLVEGHMIVILMERDIYGKNVYSSTLELYNFWINDVKERTDPSKTSEILNIIKKYNP